MTIPGTPLTHVPGTPLTATPGTPLTAVPGTPLTAMPGTILLASEPVDDDEAPASEPPPEPKPNAPQLLVEPERKTSWAPQGMVEPEPAGSNQPVSQEPEAEEAARAPKMMAEPLATKRNEAGSRQTSKPATSTRGAMTLRIEQQLGEFVDVAPVKVKASANGSEVPIFIGRPQSQGGKRAGDESKLGGGASTASKFTQARESSVNLESLVAKERLTTSQTKPGAQPPSEDDWPGTKKNPVPIEPGSAMAALLPKNIRAAASTYRVRQPNGEPDLRVLRVVVNRDE